jgi:hypothetical protein
MAGVRAMISPANSPAQPDPVSRRPTIAVIATAAAMAMTEGMRMTAGLVPTATQPCSSR